MRPGVRRASTGLLLTLMAGLPACGEDDARPPARATAPVVLLLPGSGFRGADEAAAAKLVIGVEQWEAWGFRAVPVAYGEGKAGGADTVAALRAVRSDHPTAPVCLYGESAGGTWALLTAARDRSVSCVIATAAPTDADTWRQAGTKPARYFADEVWPAYFGRGTADDVFEPADVWRRERPDDRVLLLYAADDPLVPVQQARVLAREIPDGRGTVRILGSGPRSFAHSDVAEAEFDAMLGAVRRFVAETAPPGP